MSRSWGPDGAGALRVLFAPRGLRATFHLVAGVFLGGAVGAAFVLLGVIWWSAAYSLFTGPTGHPLLPVLYAVAVPVLPLILPPVVRVASALQRERFRTVLGVDIATPRWPTGSGAFQLVRPWMSGSTWRQLLYHLLAPVLGGGAGFVSMLLWAAPVLAALWAGDIDIDGVLRVPWFAGGLLLLIAAPWTARGMARADAAAARRLLGPGRADQLAERVETLSRTRADLVAAADAERRRIERDLHDGLQQRLVSLAMNLGMARAAFTDVPGGVRDVLADAHEEATTALAELREFVRGLHPAVLNDRGLDAALSGVVARVPLPVSLTVDVAERCSPSIEAIAYFTVSEALTNVVKHAGAGRADVTVTLTGPVLTVVVSDDGHGGAAADAAGSGLRGLARRAAAVDGTLTVVSPPGGPTTVTVYLPCE